MSIKNEYILAISGASGAIYARKLFDTLIKIKARIHLIMTEEGKKIIESELDISRSYFQKDGVKIYNNSQLNHKIASGSFRHKGMIIIPASMGCIGRIASGVSTDLITRAADVSLKEKAPLICVPRETPYNNIHLKNLLTLSTAGAVILPASPAFYHKPESIDDLAMFLVDRVLCHLNISTRILPPYKPEDSKMS